MLGIGKLKSGEVICVDCTKRVVGAKKTMSGSTLDELIAAGLQKAAGQAGHQPDRIFAQLEKIGITKASHPSLMGRKEIPELGSIIGENEEIFGIVQGTFEGGIGVLIGTNRRLLFVDKGFIYGLKVQDFSLNAITSIQYETGFITADIIIIARGNAEKISNVDKTAARTFSEKVRAKLSEPAAPAAAAPVTIVQNQQVDVADQLTKLAALKTQGILTQEEFDAQKKKLLGM